MSQEPTDSLSHLGKNDPPLTKEIGKLSILMSLTTNNNSLLHREDLDSKVVALAKKQHRWKRALDMSAILLALPLLLPLGLLIAIWIKLVSRGPVLMRQERIGYQGCRFLCYKFRTMNISTDLFIHQGHLDRLMSSEIPMVKLDLQGDPRIIRGGRFLRSSGLDELPQLINIIRREMSLVGPRPCVSYEYEKYTMSQKRRFDTLPGLTGLWQVSGKNRTTFNEMIALDIFYADNRSFRLDIEILLKTIPALLIQLDHRPHKRKSVKPVKASPFPASQSEHDIG